MAEESEIDMWKKKMFYSWMIAIPIAIIMLSERIIGFDHFSHDFEMCSNETKIEAFELVLKTGRTSLFTPFLKKLGQSGQFLRASVI